MKCPNRQAQADGNQLESQGSKSVTPTPCNFSSCGTVMGLIPGIFESGIQLGNSDRQHTVLEVTLHFGGIDRTRQGHGLLETAAEVFPMKAV